MQRGTALDPRSSVRSNEATEVVRTLARRLATTGVLALGLVGAALASPGAAQEATDCADEVRVAEVSGLLDPVLVDFVEETVLDADGCGAVAVVLQVNSAGAIV